MDSDFIIPPEFSTHHHHHDHDHDHELDLTLSAADIEALGPSFVDSHTDQQHDSVQDHQQVHHHEHQQGHGGEIIEGEDDDLHLHFPEEDGQQYNEEEGQNDQQAQDVLKGLEAQQANLDHDEDNATRVWRVPFPTRTQRGKSSVSGSGSGNVSGNANGNYIHKRERLSNKESAELTSDEKKDRQRESNKKAAERSRAKKRRDLGSMEEHVAQLQRDNERIRARISALKPASPSQPASTVQSDLNQTSGPSFTDTQSPSTSTFKLPHPKVNLKDDPENIGIDYTYIARLHAELTAAKKTLYEKYKELNPLPQAGESQIENHYGIEASSREMPSSEQPVVTADSGEAPDNLDMELEELRKKLIQQSNQLKILRTEENSMSTVLIQLREETDELRNGKVRVITELIRRGIQPVDTDIPTGEMNKNLEPEKMMVASAQSRNALEGMDANPTLQEGGVNQGEQVEEDVNMDDYDIEPYIAQAVRDWAQRDGDASR